MDRRRNMHNRYNRRPNTACCEQEEKPVAKKETKNSDVRNLHVVKRCAVTVLVFVIVIWILQLANIAM